MDYDQSISILKVTNYSRCIIAGSINKILHNYTSYKLRHSGYVLPTSCPSISLYPQVCLWTQGCSWNILISLICLILIFHLVNRMSWMTIPLNHSCPLCFPEIPQKPFTGFQTYINALVFLWLFIHILEGGASGDHRLKSTCL